jgi:hypothetical protein
MSDRSAGTGGLRRSISRFRKVSKPLKLTSALFSCQDGLTFKSIELRANQSRQDG